MSRSALILGFLVAACGGRSIDSTPASSAGSSGAPAGGRAGDSSGGSDRGGASGNGTGGASGCAPIAGSGGAPVGAGGFAGATGGAGSGGASGSVSGAGGAMGGSGGDAGVSGATSGSAGVAGVAGAAGVGGRPEPTLTPCNSSQGTGCAAGEVCTVIYSGPCNPSFDENCVGYCAPILPASQCEGGLAQCGTATLCDEPPPGECPLGQRRSFVNNCWGPCVPADCCACEREEDCQPNEDLACDKQSGRCVVPAAPAPRCFLPVITGPCEPPPISRIAFIDGKCQETSVCSDSQDLELLFFTLAECLRHCEGSPQQSECPEGRTVAELCLACGAGGGCAKSGTVCAESCISNDDCDTGWCHESACQFACL